MRSLSSALLRATSAPRQRGDQSHGSWKSSTLAIVAILPLLQTACSPSAKVTAQDAAIATQTMNETTSTATAIAKSHYRTYRWLTPEEMTAYQLGYDPGLDSATRQDITRAVEDELANMGYQQGDPADFTVAFSDVYLDKEKALGNTGFAIVKGPEEKFTVAFFDAHTGKLLWRGWGKEKLSGDQPDDKRIALAVSHALADMPVRACAIAPS